MNANRTNFPGVAAAVNAAWQNGDRVTVNGHEVVYWNRAGSPATVWGTGSLSVEVRGKNARTNTVWFKDGEKVEVKVSAGAAA